LVVWRQQSSDGLGIMIAPLSEKIYAPLQFFRAEARWFDLSLTACLGIVLLWLVYTSYRKMHRGMVFAALLLFVAYLALPVSLFNSAYADRRLLPALLICAVLAVSAPNRRTANLTAIIALSLFTVRLAEVGIGWWQRGSELNAELAALDFVPIGSRIAAFSTLSACQSYPLHGYDALGNFAIVRRQAFINAQWDQPGSQITRPIYNRGQDFNGNGSLFITNPEKDCFGRDLDEALTSLPQSRFDFVWLFNRTTSRPWLQPVFTGPHSTLYRIVKPPNKRPG